VGFYDPKGKFQPESDWDSTDEAANRVHWLNGDEPYQQMEKKCTELEHRLFALETAHPALPAPVKRTWMDKYWIAWRDMGGNWNVDLCKDTYAMPYIEGEPAPDAPSEGRE